MIIERSESLHKWFVVCVSTLVLIGVYGTQLSFGVFLKPITIEFGWTRTLVSGAVSIVIGLAGPLGILTGVIADRYGARKIIAVGGLFAVSGYLLISRANSLWELYVFFGVFLGITISTTWAPLIGTVSRYFTKKRVLAIGILTSGNTMGSMFVPPIIAHFIGANVWRASFLILAIIMVVTSTPSLFILGRESDQRKDTLGQGAGLKGDKILERNKSTETGQWPAIEAVKTLAFFMVVTVGFVTAVGFFIIAVHMVPYATDMGINATSAALILSFLSMGNIIGKLLAWSITRSIGERFSLLLFVGLQAFSLF
ncbi:MAG: MFS transporter, partial [Deltaproteobacteria bacterium]|nr:MFS transporter [Deltaproteobacteria bacterium]